jgi:hypothetical protein
LQEGEKLLTQHEKSQEVSVHPDTSLSLHNSRPLVRLRRRSNLKNVGVAGLLLLVLLSTIFFAVRPQPAHAAASSAVQVKRAVALCVMQGLTMGAVAGAASDILIPIKLAKYVKNAALVRLAVTDAAAATAAEGLEVSQANLAAYWAKNGNIVVSNIVGNCLGFTFFNIYSPLAIQMFPDDIGNPNAEQQGTAFAAQVAGNPSVLCQATIGPNSTMDDSGLCYNPNDKKFYLPSGYPIGPNRCDGNKGVAPIYDSNSGYCTDDHGNYYGPRGTKAGSCVIGVPQGDGSGNCVDPKTGSKYDNTGKSLTPPKADTCTQALVNGPKGNISACTYGYVPGPKPTPVPPTPTPGPYDGTWYGAYTPYQYYNFILTVHGSSATYTLVNPATNGNPDWGHGYNYTVVGTWTGKISITNTTITGTFDSSAKPYCGTIFGFAPKDFTLSLGNSNGTHRGYSGIGNIEAYGYNGTTCTDAGPTNMNMGIYR